MSRVGTRLLRWFDQHGRHDLPWQQPRTAYRVWISEIMLQQTQVATVIGYFDRFVAAFPDLRRLAVAQLDDVLAHWSGLGYYSRARNLHRAAKWCVEHHQAQLPQTMDELMALPGIGRSTAAAILAQAHGSRVAILDANVRRVLCRLHAIDTDPRAPATERQLWQFAESHLPKSRLADYTQAIMDLGATLCTARAPACPRCPLQSECRALELGRVAELPRRRKSAAVPLRSVCVMLLTNRRGCILLERRPPSGVWGGLWSLPECADIDAAAQMLSREHGQHVAAGRSLPSFRHSFSHFALSITPWLANIGSATTKIADNDRRWFAPAELSSIGIPQPIRNLLHEVLEIDQ